MPPTPVRSSCGSIRMRQCSHHTLLKSVIGILAFSTFISTSWFHSAHLAARSLAIMEQQVPNERLNDKCRSGYVSQICPSHHYIHRVSCLHVRMATCDGNEEGVAISRKATQLSGVILNTSESRNSRSDPEQAAFSSAQQLRNMGLCNLCGGQVPLL